MKTKIKKIVFITAVAAAICFAALYVYSSDYYRADSDAVAAFCTADTIKREQCDGYTAFVPQKANAGIIFYPGGKVESAAYAPLMDALSGEGVLCVLIDMPFNLAVLDINAADGLQQKYPEVDSWYIGGHSLGGAMAASYVKKHSSEYDGLILLGSYSTADIADSKMDVISVYGSEDMVMNREKYSQNLKNLPEGYTEVIIDGGCHAYFGMYGTQEGDGIPTISNEEQIILTAEAILKML